MRRCLKTGALALLLLAAALIWCNRVGVPPALVDRVAQRALPPELDLSVQRVRLTGWNHWTLEHPRLTAPATPDVAVSAQRVDIARRRGPTGDWHFFITEGQLLVGTNPPATPDAPSAPDRLDALNGSVHLSNAGLLTVLATARIPGFIELLCEFDYALPTHRAPDAPTLAATLRAGRDGLRTAMDRLTQVLATIHVKQPVQATLRGSFGAAWEAALTIPSLQIKGTDWRMLRGTISRDGHAIRLANLHGALASTESYLHGELMADLESRAVACRLAFDGAPTLLAPLLPATTQDLLQSVTHCGHGRIICELTGNLDAPAAISALGSVDLLDVTRNGVTANRLAADFRTTATDFSASNVVAVFDSGRAGATVRVDYDQRLTVFDATGSANPHDVSRFLSPALQAIVAPFRFEDAQHYQVHGSFGTGTNEIYAIDVIMKGEQIGFGPVLADRADIALQLSNNWIAVERADLDWCDGSVSITAKVFTAGAATNLSYITDLHARNLSFPRMLGAFMTLENEAAYSGRLSATVQLGGPVVTNPLSRASGQGTVVIDKGYVFTMPLLGGLSRYLSAILPGAGYTSPHRLNAAFKLKEGLFRIDPITLDGKLLKIVGKGTYDYPTQGLDVRVQARFLNTGPAALLVQTITLPASKMLEFHLTGTVDTPRWRPLNTPRRLQRAIEKQLRRIYGTVTDPFTSPPKAE